MSKKNEAEQLWIWEQLDFFDQVEPIGLTDEIARLAVSYTHLTLPTICSV